MSLKADKKECMFPFHYKKFTGRLGGNQFYFIKCLFHGENGIIIEIKSKLGKFCQNVDKNLRVGGFEEVGKGYRKQTTFFFLVEIYVSFENEPSLVYTKT